MPLPDDVLQKLRQNYPQFADLVNLPGVADALWWCVKAGATPGEVQAAIESTPYWKQTTAQERSWDLLQATDPATAQRTWQLGTQKVWDLLDKWGVDNLNQAQLNPLVSYAVRSGMDERTLQAWVQQMQTGKPLPTTGNIGAGVAAIRGAANDFGVNVSDANAFQWSTQLAEGAIDQQFIEQQMRQQAINTYGQNNPALADALNRGQTLRQYADPYIQSAAQTLEIDSNRIDLTDPKWNSFLKPNAQGQVPNITQWETTLRSDPTYGWNNTQNARDQATKASQALSQAMGAL